MAKEDGWVSQLFWFSRGRAAFDGSGLAGVDTVGVAVELRGAVQELSAEIHH